MPRESILHTWHQAMGLCTHLIPLLPPDLTEEEIAFLKMKRNQGKLREFLSGLKMLAQPESEIVKPLSPSAEAALTFQERCVDD